MSESDGGGAAPAEGSVESNLSIEAPRPDSLDSAGLWLLTAADPVNASRWVRRRVENLRFVDDRTVHYEVVLHIDLRDFARMLAGEACLGGIPVPLLRLSRDAHTSFQVRGPDGGLLSHLNAETERELVGRGLAARYASQLASHAGPLGELLVETLKKGLPTNLDYSFPVGGGGW